jgi:hypothetical protein
MEQQIIDIIGDSYPIDVHDVRYFRVNDYENKYVIYILVNDGLIVYVGYSQCLRTRMPVHRRTKTFDHIICITLPEKTISLHLERKLTYELKPEYNMSTVNEPKNIVKLSHFYDKDMVDMIYEIAYKERVSKQEMFNRMVRIGLENYSNENNNYETE